MEKFLVTGHSKATESESCKQFRLSLPIAKRYEPHIVKKGEEQLYPLDIIYKAVYKKKYEPLHFKPLVFKHENLLELPLSLQQILAKHPYPPLAQGPLLAPNYRDERKSVSKVLTEWTVFSHDDCQDCYELFPVSVGVDAWGRESHSQTLMPLVSTKLSMIM